MILNKIKEKLPLFRQSLKTYRLALVSALIAAIITYIGLGIVLQRTWSLNLVKIEINKFQHSLLELGYDIAYDEASFGKFSPFSLLTFKNFKIYATNADDYFEWSTPELKINTGIFSPATLSISGSRNQEFQRGNQKYPAEFPVFKVDLKFDQEIGLKDITIEGVGLNIQGLATIGSLKLASQRMAPRQISEFTPFFENHVELENVVISEDIDFPLLKTIERVYLNANIIGVIGAQESYAKSFDAWLRLGGIIDIKKLIINWSPLILVGRGDLYFNDQLEPNLHLNTSSKAFIEQLDKLQDSYLERKGVFVAKILLNNKKFKLNKDDKYYTVTTPININSNQILIENIPVKSFNSKK